jgi:lipoate-protein ligase A
MALDEALARRLPDGCAVLRLYRWSDPTISLGRNEPTAGVRERRHGSDLPVVRRPTGGRAVVHDDELTYALVVPARAVGGARATYLQVNRALTDAMRSLGAPAHVAGDDSAGGGGDQAAAGTLPLDSGPCFQSPAPGEVMVDGRKLIGSAQARLGPALLQHGSIILSGDQSRLEQLAPGASSLPRPATLSDLIGAVDAATVAAVVARSIGERFRDGGTESAYTAEELDVAATLVDSKYGRPEWTWRR